MTGSNSNQSTDGDPHVPFGQAGSKKALRIVKWYVCLHAVVAACACFCVLEYLIGTNIQRSVLGCVIACVAAFGSYVFIPSSPIVILVVFTMAMDRDREWLYLTIADAGIYVLHFTAVWVGLK